MTAIPPLAALPGPAAAEGAQIQGASPGSRLPLPAKSGDKTTEAFRQFESFVLQSFIETMLPKGAESVFGKGTAGSVWKSMLAEKLADQISRSGGIGIAQRIASGHAAEALPVRASATHESLTAAESSPGLSLPPERGDDL